MPEEERRGGRRKKKREVLGIMDQVKGGTKGKGKKGIR